MSHSSSFLRSIARKGGFHLVYHQYFLVLDAAQRGVHLHPPYPPWICHCRGSNFLSELISEVCKLLGIEKVNTLGYHPQSDGIVEKLNGTLTNMLSKCVQRHGRDWDKQLPYLLFAYRVAVQESTQDSPYFLLYGRDARTPTETALSQPRTPYQVDFTDYKTELLASLSEAWALAHSHIDQAQEKQKQQYDRKSKEV